MNKLYVMVLFYSCNLGQWNGSRSSPFLNFCSSSGIFLQDPYWTELYDIYLNRSMNLLSVLELPRYMLTLLAIWERRCLLWLGKLRLNRDLLIIWKMNLKRYYSFSPCVSASTTICVHTLHTTIQVQREFHLPPGDFPNVEQFRETLTGYSFDKFEKLKPSMIKAVDDMLGYDIPELLKNFRNPYD